MPWAPTVTDGYIPAQAPFNKASVVAYVSLNDFAYNFGHALYDFLFPVFNVLQLMKVYQPDFQLLLAKHQVSARQSKRATKQIWVANGILKKQACHLS